MKRKLFLEIYAQSILIYIKNDKGSIEPMDLTGGYGTLDVGLNLLILNQESFVGQDALQFDLDDKGRYLDNVLSGDIDFIESYLVTLLDKIRDYTSYKNLDQLVIIHDHHHGIESLKKRYPKRFEDLDLDYVTYTEAVAGYGCHHQESLVIVDEERIRSYKVHKVLVEESRKRCSVISSDYEVNTLYLDNFYQDLLADELELMSKEEKKPLSDTLAHDLRRLYLTQKNTLRKLHLGMDRVSIYSSISFPPRKVVIERVSIEGAFEKLKGQVDNCLKSLEVLKEDKDSVDDFLLSGRWEILRWVLPDDKFMGLKGGQGLLSYGADYYLEERESGNDLLSVSSLGFTIGIIEEEYHPLVFEDEPYHKGISLDLMIEDDIEEVTLYKEKEGQVKELARVSLDNHLDKGFFNHDNLGFRRIKIYLNFDSNKEVKEVYHEFGKL